MSSCKLQKYKKNFSSLESFLHVIGNPFCTIGLTETWLRNSDPKYNLDGFKFMGNNRVERRGGGVGIYVRDDFVYKQRVDLDINVNCMESILLKFKIQLKILLLVLFKDLQVNLKMNFLKSLNSVLNIVNKENKYVYLIGDYNINILTVDSCSKTNEFLDVFMTKSMYPVIHYPTRITDHSISLIDNIFTNNIDDVLSGVILADISDHFPVFCISNSQITLKKSQTTMKRNINEISIRKCINLLNDVNWRVDNEDPNVSYNNFLYQFMQLYNKCFPLRSIKFKKKRRDKSWFTNTLRKMCNKKYKLYKKSSQNPTDYRKSVYKMYRNKLNHEIKHVKYEYFKNKFQNVQYDMEETWKLINKAIGNSFKTRDTNIKYIQVNNERVTDDLCIAQEFNNYFVNIGASLRNNVQNTLVGNNNHMQYLENNNVTAFFKPITTKEIIDIVCDLKSKSSTGYDEIDIVIVKRVVHIICYPLCRIFNESMNQGIFLEKLKIAKVIPVYKNGSFDTMSNYRPISVLPVFSKILEKCFYNRLIYFLNQCNLLSDSQYGFRAGHSTSSALIDFVYKVSNALDNKQIMLGIFLDLSKAFDTLDHKILLDKLFNYGIRGVLLKWFESYLTS